MSKRTLYPAYKRKGFNYTLYNIRKGVMRFKRRLDIQMWHIDHLTKSIDELSAMVNELRRIKNSNTLRNSDKCLYAQMTITAANQRFAAMTPSDPRDRGAEHLEYTNQGLVDKNGHDEIAKREDLLEYPKPVEFDPKG